MWFGVRILFWWGKKIEKKAKEKLKTSSDKIVGKPALQDA